eukprot:scaffold5364_cov156-Skeletonema_menzelii.AAC.3
MVSAIGNRQSSNNANSKLKALERKREKRKGLRADRPKTNSSLTPKRASDHDDPAVRGYDWTREPLWSLARNDRSAPAPLFAISLSILLRASWVSGCVVGRASAA